MRALQNLLLVLAAMVWGGAALAQQTVWLQIEAKPTLQSALERARELSSRLDELAGYKLSTGWYALVLGPLAPEDAQLALIQLRATGQIPSDSYIVDGSAFGARFWPQRAENAATQAQNAPTQPEVSSPQPAEQSVAEARRAESRLSADERKLVQRALNWEGFYSSAIDGAFGPGTRRAMKAWQEKYGYSGTGVLTTAQRQRLIEGYQAVVASVGIAPWNDDVAGIAIDLPLGVVAFDHYEPPFVHFAARDGGPARVLLISQSGDRDALRGLYEAMQTLEIVPMKGERRLRSDRFTLTGQDDRLTSYTFARLSRGEIKGFTLVWPAGDDKRFRMVLERMRQSFAPEVGTVMPDDYGEGATPQSPDLLAGLAIRKPAATQSGVFVTPDGAVLTASAGLDQCSSLTIDDGYPMHLAAADDALGIALLRPDQALAPEAVARLRLATPTLRSEVAAAGYSYGGRLGAPTLSYGTLEDLRDLDGRADRLRLSLEVTKGDVGGPVLDDAGALLGPLLAPAGTANRLLPADVHFAANPASVAEFLSMHGVAPAAADPAEPLAPADLSALADKMTVLVNCWN